MSHFRENTAEETPKTGNRLTRDTCEIPWYNHYQDIEKGVIPGIHMYIKAELNI